MTRFITSLLLICPFCVLAQTGPKVSPQAFFIITNKDGSVDTTAVDPAKPQSAPLTVQFKANPSGLEGYGIPRYEWKIWNNEDPSEILIYRSEEDTQHTFTESGSFTAQLYVTFYNADGSVYYEFPEEGEDPQSIIFSISIVIVRQAQHVTELMTEGVDAGTVTVAS